jgi:hypothetical protein
MAPAVAAKPNAVKTNENRGERKASLPGFPLDGGMGVGQLGVLRSINATIDRPSNE